MQGHAQTHMNPVTPTRDPCGGVVNPLGRGSHPCAGATPPSPRMLPPGDFESRGGEESAVGPSPRLTPSPHLGGRSSCMLCELCAGTYVLKFDASTVYFVEKRRGDFEFAMGSDFYEL